MSGPPLHRLLLAGCLAGGCLAGGWTGGLQGRAVAGEPQAPAVATASSPRSDTDWTVLLRRSAEALLWTDELVRHDWRLQRRPGTDACRLLDPHDAVVVEGTRQSCLDTLARLGREGRVPPVTGPTVIVLHGLGEGRRSMQPLVESLRQALDATVLSFGYASTSTGLDDHGRALDACVRDMPEADGISFVGHSMGNLVVRRWMTLAAPADLSRVRRMVMLGPPNQGSELARQVAKIGILASLSNGAARELVLEWQRIAPELAVPPCPFGIVAGGKGDERGYSGFLAGDDDAVVRVEETRLPGADAFLLLPVRHSAMMKHAGVQRATAAFLETGRFDAPAAP